ncbi:MAG: response regulator transcription factor [Bacteroidales bacterium]|nr:response regulator transcription factor [Bacteroidales bacterium]
MNTEDFRVMIVDDEKDVLEFLGYNLKKEGYQVFSAKNGLEAVELAKKITPHLIIMDVMMPIKDGVEACHEIRQFPHLADTIVLFLTARGEDYSQIAGFEAGGDDYVTKPIKPKVLVSRVKALLRRYKSPELSSGLIKLNEITIDKEKYVVIKEDKEITLPKKEFELLMLLGSKPDKVFTREQILSNVWGNDVVVGGRTIDVHVRKIREKLEIKNIKTIKGVGYKYQTS